MAVASDTRQKILHDYRNKVVTSAAALAKKHGISKSSVYRILSEESGESGGKKSGKSSSPPSKATGPPKMEPPKLEVADKEENESVASSVSASFYRRSDRFADDLGLQASNLRVSEDERIDPEEREAEIDLAMDRILGEKAPDFEVPEFLNAPLPPRPGRPGGDSIEVVATTGTSNAPVVVNTGLIDREDTVQRIIFIAENFGVLVVGITGPDVVAFTQRLPEKSDLELTRLLRTLERTRSVGNIAAGFKQLMFFTGSATEAATKLIGMKTDGFVDRLREQEREITMIMKEIAMNQWERVKALDSPEMRLGSLFCLTLLQTDAVNRMKQAVRPEARVPANVVSAHADL